MRLVVSCIIALCALTLGSRSARAEEYGEVCRAVFTVAERVALRSDGAIGYAGTKLRGQTDADYGIVYNWSELKDYNPNRGCPPNGIQQDVLKMCQEFLAANAPDKCPTELEKRNQTVTNQAKQTRRLARDNKRLRDLLKRPRPVGEARK